MTDFEILVDGQAVDPAEDTTLVVDDERHGVGRLIHGGTVVPVIVEGRGSDRVVTIAGRRIPVTVRSWRERVLAEAETAAAAHAGPVSVKATLPGLVVAVAVGVGDEVEAGDSLLTIEAMKMQNEVRAPRAGRVIELTVEAGRTVATGADLLRLE
ncbi:MAG: biotin/lipoyl-binding protein [Chloroflexi bacterium]|nr:biotin/lipoyl-binding protein [Chloroflexota bacterium]